MDEIAILCAVAPVAQLDRASGYEPEGRQFESVRAHHRTVPLKDTVLKFSSEP
jgi:hypothetical protein